jgi:hypothetical protein
MINLLDELLRDVLVANVPNLTAGQVRFEPPTKNWYRNVTTPAMVALDIYLADLRENRKLRSNERTRVLENGTYTEEQSPARIDCHYLITAWSQTTPGVGLEPALEEHLLLHQAATVLVRFGLNPSRVYSTAPGSPLFNWPTRFQDHELPTVVAPTEGFARLAEFWQSMGADSPWRPALYVVVTLPIELLREVVGPMVTTRITEYGVVGGSAMTDVWVQVGGRVRDATSGPPKPVPGAWVQLETLTGDPVKATETDAAGRFMFGELRAGRYQIRVRAERLGELTPRVDIPSPAGGYEIEFV